MSEQKSSCGSCGASDCSAKHARPGETPEQEQDRLDLKKRLCRIRYKVVVMSGKGGVGKSTTAVNLALALADLGHAVGILDVDLHGPSVPKLLNLHGGLKVTGHGTVEPALFHSVKVMSVGFMLRHDTDPVVWRGPLKMGAIRQFLKDVEWGDLDYLVIDCPPGTGDESLSVIQLLEEVSGAVIVTTPQELALLDVRKSITFCRQLNVPVLGVIENMSGFTCPHCGEVVDVFKRGGGEAMAEQMQVPFLGRIPLDPEMVAAGDSGEPYVLAQPEAPSAEAFRQVALRTVAHCTLVSAA